MTPSASLPDDLLVNAGDEVRIRVVSKRKPSEFLGALRTKRAFPGKEAVRNTTAKSLAARHQESRG